MTSSDPSPPHEGTRVWQADWPVDLPRTLGSLRRGAGDLTTLLPAAGQFVLAANTPAGPGTLHLGVGSSPRQVHARAWGGAAAVDWLLDGVPELLGARDRPQDFQPVHEPLVRAHAHWSPRLRVMRTRRVWDALLPAVIEQKVTGQEAFAGYRALVAAAGSPAPGPAGDRGLRVPPGPREVLGPVLGVDHRGHRCRPVRCGAPRRPLGGCPRAVGVLDGRDGPALAGPRPPGGAHRPGAGGVDRCGGRPAGAG